MKKSFWLASALLVGLGVAFIGQSLANQPANMTKTYRVVVQVNVAGDEQYDELLRNVENLVKAIGQDNLEVALITHGKGLGLLTTENLQIRDRLAALANGGNQVSACSNTCRAKNITADDLAPYVTIIDSGVAEVVRRQTDGWAYLKTGS